MERLRRTDLLLLIGVLVGTPVILIWSGYDPDAYGSRVKRGYRFVWRAWRSVARRC